MSAGQLPEIKPVVFLIESLSAQDVLDERAEGRALCEALDLADIPNHYYRVSDVATMREAFDRIGRKFQEHRKKSQQIGGALAPVPNLHFSGHGDEDGLYLTDQSRIVWKDLSSLMRNFCDQNDLIAEEYLENAGLLSVAFSSCRGGYAKHLFDRKPYPCTGIVGPNEDVAWEDSLTAYITYYHLTISKSQGVEYNKPSEVLPIMNSAAGLDKVFEGYNFESQL